MMIGVMRAGWLTLFWIGVAVAPRACMAAGREKIYWSDRAANTIRRANLDGSEVEALVSGTGEFRGVAIDIQSHQIYWADNGGNKIQRSLLDGSQVEDLVTQGLGFPAGIALDVASNKMYWADAQLGHIQQANLDGTNVKEIVTGLVNPYFVTVDPLNHYVFWTDYGTDKIQRANLDGTQVIDVVTTGLSLPRGVDLDLQHGKLYWADRQTDRIQRANLDGSNIEDLHQAMPTSAAPHGVAVDPLHEHVYWVDNGLVTIKRMDSTGANVVELLNAASGVLSAPWQIVLDLRTTPPGCASGQMCSATSEGERIDQVSAAILQGSYLVEHDYNRDGQTSAADRTFLVDYVLNTFPGDADLDGQFDTADLVTVLQAGLYEDAMPANAGWSTGDWTGDLEFDTADLVVSLSEGRYETNAAAVPEPRSWLLAALAAGGLMRHGHSRFPTGARRRGRGELPPSGVKANGRRSCPRIRGPR